MTCWNILFPVEKIDVMYRFNWSLVIYKYSFAFKVCSNISTGLRDVQENALQSIMPPPPAYV